MGKTVQPFPALRASWDHRVPKGFTPEDRVYKMTDVYEDVRFTTLRLRGNRERPRDPFEFAWENPKKVNLLRKRWRAPLIEDKVASWNDIPMLGRHPAFSEHAVECLHDILERDGTLFPLRCPRRKFFAFVPHVRDDLLDYDESFLSWERENRKKQISDIKHYVFRKQRLIDVAIFGIAHRTYETYVTNAFVQRVKDAGLLGATYEIVFPLPASHNWFNLRWRALRRHWRDGLPAGQSINGKCLTILFQTEYPHESTTAKQDRIMTKWAWEFDATLRDYDSILPQMYVDRAQPEDQGGYVVQLCGPDEAKLRTVAAKLIRGAKWPGKVRLSTR